MVQLHLLFERLEPELVRAMPCGGVAARLSKQSLSKQDEVSNAFRHNNLRRAAASESKPLCLGQPIPSKLPELEASNT